MGLYRNGRTDGRTDRQAYVRTDVCMYVWMDRFFK